MAESTHDRVGVSYIELGSEEKKNVPPTKRELDEIESMCNEAIRRAEPVTVKVYQQGDPELKEVCPMILINAFINGRVKACAGQTGRVLISKICIKPRW